MRKWVLTTGLAVVAAGAVGIGLLTRHGPTMETAAVEPGGDAAAAALAQNNPDEFAWQLFQYMNLQAAGGQAGAAAPGATMSNYDEDRPVVWETWALASGVGASQEGSEVFKPDGSDPGDWGRLPRGTVQPKAFSVELKLAAARVPEAANAPPRTVPVLRGVSVAPNIFIGPGTGPQGEEVRINRAAFEFIQTNGLYNVEGLLAKYEEASRTGNRDLIQFPPATKEIKAYWLPTANPAAISADEKARYHWRKVGKNYYKLAALHIITKDIKEWFWADFAQEDFERRGVGDTQDWALPSRNSTTRGPNAPAKGSKEGERKELTGSKWSHYRLRGSQIAFLDAAGLPTVIGNVLLEGRNANKSSCMTCHFAASVGPQLPDGSLSGLPFRFVTGEPDRTALGTGTDIRFLQTDFVFSIPARAQRRQIR